MPRALCARNYGSIAVSDVGIADTKSIRDIGSLRKGGSLWQQQPQSAPTWWKLVARICWKCKSYEEWELSWQLSDAYLGSTGT